MDDEDGTTTQFYKHMLFVGGGTLVGAKGRCFRRLCNHNKIRIETFKGVHVLDDNTHEHKGFHSVLPLETPFSPLHASFSKKKRNFE